MGHPAAELARAGKLRRFGFVTTNSITQVFDRKVVAQNLNAAKNPLSLVFRSPITHGSRRFRRRNTP